MNIEKVLMFAAVVVSVTVYGLDTGPQALSQTARQQAGTKRSGRSVAGHTDTPASLPVRRVSLYKNGVGFFEHAGSVTGNQEVTIDFSTSQLNDVLQSLTAIDLNGGHIGGAGYNSTTPLDQQLKALPLALGTDVSAADFYQAIRGARLEVHSGNATFTGRLLNIEVRQGVQDENEKNKPAIEKRYLTLVSDAGAVKTIELGANTEVRLLDTAIHQDLKQYLELLAKTSNQELRHLTLDAIGTGTRELHVSYLSEVPVWKATYRILFSNFSNALNPSKAAQTATLQGWAVVDNTVGTDWDNVELSLIAGAPQSFIQPISQPYYSRRPEIGLPQEAQLTPQTHESGEPSAAVGQGSGGGMGSGSGEGFGPGNASAAAGAAMAGPVNSGPLANGRFLDRADVMAKLQAPPPISYEDSAKKSVAPDTKTSAFDDYFEYKLSSPITIRKNESALVPILQEKVEAERITLWSPSQPQALRALWLTNTTNLTLDRGSFSIVEDGRFGGEGLLDPIHPKERRLLSYAADQAVRVTTEHQNNNRKLQQVTVSKGILTERTLEIAEVDYLVHNAAPEARSVIVEQPVRPGWELDSEVKPAEKTGTAYRFQVATPAGETVRLHIGERHTLSRGYQLASMGTDQLDYMIRTNGEDVGLRQQLAPILDAKRKLADLDAQLTATQKAMDDIAADQNRVRANLTALKGSAEERALTRRYADELNQQEDRLAALRKEQETIRGNRAVAELRLSAAIDALQIDEKLN